MQHPGAAGRRVLALAEAIPPPLLLFGGCPRTPVLDGRRHRFPPQTVNSCCQVQA